MSYREENGQVILTMSRDDFERVLMRLGAATGLAIQRSANLAETLYDELALLNRLNEGNPNFTPYKLGRG